MYERRAADTDAVSEGGLSGARATDDGQQNQPRRPRAPDSGKSVIERMVHGPPDLCGQQPDRRLVGRAVHRLRQQFPIRRRHILNDR
jgi:hypothetical protein